MKISAVIITYNEEERLGAALESLRSVVDEVLVVDSHSLDHTAEIARAAGARVELHRFEDYGSQKNYAMGRAGHEWVLNLDADERVSPELAAAIAALKAQGVEGGIAAFSIRRRTFYLGRWIRHSGWYPDRKVRLFRRNGASWQGRIHERLVVAGRGAPRAGDNRHFTNPDKGDHVRRLERYSGYQAEEIVRKGTRLLHLRLLVLPAVTFLRHYFWRLGFLDGFPGLVIALVQSWGTAMKHMKAIALKRRPPAPVAR